MYNQALKNTIIQTCIAMRDLSQIDKKLFGILYLERGQIE